MSDIRDFAFSRSSQGGNSPVFGCAVRDTSSSLFKSESYLVITHCTLDFYKVKHFKLKESFMLLGLTGIKTDAKEMQLEFGKKKFKLESEQNNRIFGTIVYLVRRVMTPDELSNLKLIEFGIKPLIFFGVGAFMRIKAKLQCEGVSVPQATLSLLEKITRTQAETIDLNDFKNPQQMSSYILDSMQLMPHVNSLIVPILQYSDIFDFLRQHLSKLTNIKHIDITGKATQSFRMFLSDITNNLSFQFTSLSFTDSYFQESDLKTLLQFIETKRISSLGLHNAISESAFGFFYSKQFFSPMFYTNISQLNLDYSKSLCIAKLIPFVTSLSSLSLAYCRLQIADVFSCLMKAPIANLRAINLSGNMCSFMSEEIAFPYGCTHFVADDVQWGQNALAILLYNAFNRVVPQFSLSLNNAKMNSSEWTNVFKIFWQSKFSQAVDFSWNGNPISPMLLGFLARQTKLCSLSINGTLRESSPELFQYFISFCTESPIQTLSICGENTHKIGRLFGAVARGLIAAKNLKYLDLSNNKISDNGLDLVKQIIAKARSLKTINFDGSCPFTPGPLISACKSTKIEVYYPENDVDMLLEHNMLSEDQMKYIKNICSVAIEQSSTSLFEPESSIYSEPLMRLPKPLVVIFSPYISQEMISTLKSIQIQVPVPITIQPQKPTNPQPQTQFSQSQQQQQHQQQRVQSQQLSQAQHQQSQQRHQHRHHQQETPEPSQSSRKSRKEGKDVELIRTNQKVIQETKPEQPSQKKTHYHHEKESLPHHRRPPLIDTSPQVNEQPIQKLKSMKTQRRKVLSPKQFPVEMQPVSPRRSASIKGNNSPTVSPKKKYHYHSDLDYDEDEFDDYNDVSLDLSDEHVPTPKPFRGKVPIIEDDYDEYYSLE